MSELQVMRDALPIDVSCDYCLRRSGRRCVVLHSGLDAKQPHAERVAKAKRYIAIDEVYEVDSSKDEKTVTYIRARLVPRERSGVRLLSE